MWPKAFAQLVELAPHISRLLPMADRFLQTKNLPDEGSRKALEAVAEGWRGDLRQIATAHAGLQAQIAECNDKLTVVATTVAGLATDAGAAAADARTARLTAESAAASLAAFTARYAAESLEPIQSMQGRLLRIETQQRRMLALLGVALLLLVVLCVLAVLALNHAH